MTRSFLLEIRPETRRAYHCQISSGPGSESRGKRHMRSGKLGTGSQKRGPVQLTVIQYRYSKRSKVLGARNSRR